MMTNLIGRNTYFFGREQTIVGVFSDRENAYLILEDFDGCLAITILESIQLMPEPKDD
jgi:hypothetical protein